MSFEQVVYKHIPPSLPLLTTATQHSTVVATASNSPTVTQQGELGYQRTLLLSGVRAGQLLPEKTRAAIIADKYVDFRDIVAPDLDMGYSVSVGGQQGQQSLTLTPHKRDPISQTAWSSAWDDFMAVYSQAHPQTLIDLISDGKGIKRLMAKGQDWRHYDCHSCASFVRSASHGPTHSSLNSDL